MSRVHRRDFQRIKCRPGPNVSDGFSSSGRHRYNDLLGPILRITVQSTRSRSTWPLILSLLIYPEYLLDRSSGEKGIRAILTSRRPLN